ncbi:heterokaryon incompatibility protein-domain-containing protein [Cadophora sp. MPI-SDFR-AT-0126]|nr:heterokaryon incompatibility protein-domain-containing protein [Leotiomycetes sp. MPI-SDFR-AT-0126]
MGFAVWFGDSNSLSNEAIQVVHSILVQERNIERSNRVTDLKKESPPSNGILNYPRLSENEKTRLIILEPGEPTDELRCHLKPICSLYDHEYEALSYVWGEESSEHTIQCSGMKIQITANLDDALRQLRYIDRSRLLWVDAISINQHDLAERSRQVRIMQEIYANAAQVVIWLGRAAEGDARAFASLQALKSVLIGQDDSWFLVRLGWYRDKTGKVFSGGAHRSMVTDIEYEHLITLLHREWFRRTWIIQEVASSRGATVHCGNQIMPWEILADVYIRLGDRFLPVSQMGGEDAHHSLENIGAIERARRSHSGPLSMSLFHILLATRFSECKDQRDKIFAVVGLAKDWAGQRGLVPDYDTNEEKVLEAFKEFAVTDINHHKNLRVLSCASGPKASSSLPSWVPDWRVVENVHPLTRYSERTRFCASGGMKPEAWHSDNKTVLHVTGLQIDSIFRLGSEPEFTKAVAVFEINEAKISALKQSYLWLLECENLSRQHRGILTTMRQTELWRTMTCGLTGEAFPAPYRYAHYFNRYMGFMSSASERFEDYLTESRTTVTGIRGLDEVIPNFETHAVIEASLDLWSSRRRFSVTRNGRLACVPRGSRVGDSICILFGGEVPYVLRPAGGGYFTVIGECYVDGIMHGESLSFDTTSREFRLR